MNNLDDFKHWMTKMFWNFKTPCYIIKEWFFILIIFYELYFIIQSGKALNHLSLLVQVQSDGAVLRLCRKDIIITICHNKPPDRKWGWSVDDVMPRCDGPENFRILKREELGIRPLKVQLGFLLLRHAVEFFGPWPAEMNWDLKHYMMRHALGWGQHSMVSIGF